jgi:hypothetical protein
MLTVTRAAAKASTRLARPAVLSASRQGALQAVRRRENVPARSIQTAAQTDRVSQSCLFVLRIPPRLRPRILHDAEVVRLHMHVPGLL